MVAAQAKAVIGIMIFIIALTRHGVGICLPLHSSECFLSRVRPAGTGKESRLGFKPKTKEKAGLRNHPIVSLFDFTLDNIGPAFHLLQCAFLVSGRMQGNIEIFMHRQWLHSGTSRMELKA